MLWLRAQGQKAKNLGMYGTCFVLCAANDSSSCSMDLAPPPHIRSLLMANRHQSFTHTLLALYLFTLPLVQRFVYQLLFSDSRWDECSFCVANPLSYLSTALMNGKFHDNKPIEYLVNGAIVYDVGDVWSWLNDQVNPTCSKCVACSSRQRKNRTTLVKMPWLLMHGRIIMHFTPHPTRWFLWNLVYWFLQEIYGVDFSLFLALSTYRTDRPRTKRPRTNRPGQTADGQTAPVTNCPRTKCPQNKKCIILD